LPKAKPATTSATATTAKKKRKKRTSEQPGQGQSPTPAGRFTIGLWADVVDPRTGAYRHDVLSMLSDPMAQRIIGVIHDGFLADDDSRMIDWFDFSNECLSGIMRELEEDRDRITRILSVLEGERTKLQKR
jgi:hypothetical protein